MAGCDPILCAPPARADHHLIKRLDSDAIATIADQGARVRTFERSSVWFWPPFGRQLREGRRRAGLHERKRKRSRKRTAQRKEPHLPHERDVTVDRYRLRLLLSSSIEESTEGINCRQLQSWCDPCHVTTVADAERVPIIPPRLSDHRPRP